MPTSNPASGDLAQSRPDLGEDRTLGSWGAHALIGVAIYAFACWFWPFTDCRKCEGQGWFRSPSRKNWRKCRRCKGSGSRVRLGRRVVDLLNTSRKAAQ